VIESSMKPALTIHDLPAKERPRERLQRQGAEVLSTPEIIALILGRGTAGMPVLDIAKSLLKEFKDVEGISGASLEQLMNIPGIKIGKASQIIAAFELTKRMAKRLEPGETVPYLSPRDIAVHLRHGLMGQKREHFLAMLLDTRNKLIKEVEISVGCLDTNIVHPREVYKEAITASAASVIFAHNHPSGDCTPSTDDIELTKRLAKAGDIFGIDVLDHIIVSDSGYLSLKEKGLM
jgi:DNA repair protein RadC